MGQLLLIVVVAVTIAAVVFGVTVLVSGRDAGLQPAEPDGRALPLPTTRPLRESDLGDVRFDMATRGYRMAQVDQALRRAAYDIGYKDELIGVLEAEVNALRDGRVLDADALRRAREAAQAPTAAEPPAKPGWTEFTRPAEADEVAESPTEAESGDTAPVADAGSDPVAADVPPAPSVDDAPGTAEAHDAADADVPAPAPAEDATPAPAEAETAGGDQVVAATAEPAAPVEAAGESAAPAKPTRSRARQSGAAGTTTRAPRSPRKAASAAEPPTASSESAPSVKEAIEAETPASATDPSTEDAGSARR